MSKYRLLHHALDQAKTTNSHTAIKSTLQEVVRVLNEQKVAPLKHEIDTLLQDPV